MQKYIKLRRRFIKMNTSKYDRIDEYKEYLTTHISNVKKAYEIIEDKLLSDSDLTAEELTQLNYNIKNHDKSKYEDVEFYPYLCNFYPSNKNKLNQNEYDYAWLHHQHLNPHHWQHWILREDENNIKLLDMPDIYVIEMLCDWSSFQYNNPESTANKWYNDNKDKMLLSQNTIQLIEKYLKLFN